MFFFRKVLFFFWMKVHCDLLCYHERAMGDNSTLWGSLALHVVPFRCCWWELFIGRTSLLFCDASALPWEQKVLNCRSEIPEVLAALPTSSQWWPVFWNKYIQPPLGMLQGHPMQVEKKKKWTHLSSASFRIKRVDLICEVFRYASLKTEDKPT